MDFGVTVFVGEIIGGSCKKVWFDGLIMVCCEVTFDDFVDTAWEVVYCRTFADRWSSWLGKIGYYVVLPS